MAKFKSAYALSTWTRRSVIPPMLPGTGPISSTNWLDPVPAAHSLPAIDLLPCAFVGCLAGWAPFVEPNVGLLCALCTLEGQDLSIGIVMQGIGPVLQVVTPLMVVILLPHRPPKDEVKLAGGPWLEAGGWGLVRCRTVALPGCSGQSERCLGICYPFPFGVKGATWVGCVWVR